MHTYVCAYVCAYSANLCMTHVCMYMCVYAYIYSANLCMYVHEITCTLLDCHGVILDNWLKSLVMPSATTSNSDSRSSSQSDLGAVFHENS